MPDAEASAAVTAPTAPTAPKVRRARKPAPVLTTAQRLGSVIKSARDIMRKDKGLNGDLDRLPMLTWVMFLKFLDDMERVGHDAAALGGKAYIPVIEAPYRWRDWAGESSVLTGDALLHFLADEKTVRPGGTEGPGLFAYLRTLRGTGRRDVIASVFNGLTNRMTSGFLLKDVVNLVDAIHFNSRDEIHTLGHLYESMLKEMRDAAGDSGEFYTPRAVVRFMVAAVDPKLGETVLDPACGTGGFLVEAYNHLAPQADTVARRAALQRDAIRGNEAKGLPYLLAQMNLMLHGLESPRIDPGNSLAVKLTEIGDAERVDVVLTNPPFGGVEEASITNGFPPDLRTSETALLFLQLIMRKLRGGSRPGRAAVVVPNGTLFGDGVAARIKAKLLTDFNLHTVVRLPTGVFEPYTPIPTNVLLFARTGPTRDVWFYEQPLPPGRKKYTKTAPLQYEDFAGCLAWWHDRKPTDQAWSVPATELLARGCNLDVKNPTAKAGLEHLPPEQLVAAIVEKEQRILAIMNEVKAMLAGGVA